MIPLNEKLLDFSLTNVFLKLCKLKKLPLLSRSSPEDSKSLKGKNRNLVVGYLTIKIFSFFNFILNSSLPVPDCISHIEKKQNLLLSGRFTHLQFRTVAMFRVHNLRCRVGIVTSHAHGPFVYSDSNQSRNSFHPTHFLSLTSHFG
jgi:hypothetical protein